MPFYKGYVCASSAAICCGLLLSLSAPQPASAGGVYFVKQGDTLPGVSRLFGVDAARLRQVNRLGREIRPGDRLRIPDREPVEAPRAAPPAALRAAEPDRVQQALCREDTVYHTVARGDTLAAISRRYSETLENLLRLNHLTKRSRLDIGQRILVRRGGPSAHVVAPGETLTQIARLHAVPLAQIRRLNRGSGDDLAIGQRLLLQECDPLATAGSAPPPLPGARTAAADAPAGAAPAPLEAAVRAPSEDELPAAAQTLIAFARTMLDIPYRFGGTTLRGIDCSAYVQRVFEAVDLRIPRTAREQFRLGARVDRHEIEVGDLVFFRTYASFPSHVGIYVGDNQFIHASSVGRKVTIDSMDRSYYRKRFIGARRLLATGLAAR